MTLIYKFRDFIIHHLVTRIADDQMKAIVYTRIFRTLVIIFDYWRLQFAFFLRRKTNNSCCPPAGGRSRATQKCLCISASTARSLINMTMAIDPARHNKFTCRIYLLFAWTQPFSQCNNASLFYTNFSFWDLSSIHNCASPYDQIKLRQGVSPIKTYYQKFKN